MKHLILIVILTFSFTGKTQIVFDKTSHNFGKLYGDQDRFVDFYLKNTSQKPIYLLSVRHPMDIGSLRGPDQILPDSSTVLRFQINKNSTGKFNYSIPVYTSDKDEPTTIILIGSIETLPINNNFTSCPNFNQQPSDGNPLDFSLTVETIDKETKKKLGESTVTILQNGFPLGKWKTDKKALLKLRTPLGYSYFYATHDGYFPAEEALYINHKNNYVVLELEPKKEMIIPPVIEEPIAENDLPIEEPEPMIIEEEITEEVEEDERLIVIDINETPEIDISDIIEVEEKVIKDKPIEEITEKEEFIPPSLNELPIDNFDDKLFKPINITFIIDISASMNQYGRIDLMKYSLNQLINLLRPQDKMGIVAYSSNAFEILESTCGDQKENLKEEVRSLKASGHTDGYAGIRLGYRKAWQNRIKEGEQHVIIITDGGFNKNSGNYKKLIKDNFEKKKITLSVVGVKSNETAAKNLTEAAKLGNGRLILIDNLSDAQIKLIEDIREVAFRY
ncbi:MAG: VWA domain-containing protein [Brumimicrobium sp.]